jgi:hypothetical protein
MFFGTSHIIDGNIALTICLRTAERAVLFSCKGKRISEGEVIAAIEANRGAMTAIRLAARRGQVLEEDGLLLVPVTITATPQHTPEPLSEDAEIWITDSPKTADSVPSTSVQVVPNNSNPPPEQVQFLQSLHSMSLTTLGIIIKSANEALGKVAEAQSEGLKALSLNFNQVHQSIQSYGNLPAKIFESSDQKVEALLELAHQRAAAKHGESVQAKDMLTELKEVVGFVQSMKGVFSNG